MVMQMLYRRSTTGADLLDSLGPRVLTFSLDGTFSWPARNPKPEFFRGIATPDSTDYALIPAEEQRLRGIA